VRYTVLGAGGFIGSRLAAALRGAGHEVLAPARGDAALEREPLGHAIYCVGLTADFRSRPFDTVRAHVGLLAEVLERSRFDSLLYLSSTRVYARAASGREDALIAANPLEPDDFYNVTKLAGESLCFAAGREGVRVARLSNVYGHDPRSENFLSTVLRADAGSGRVAFATAWGSAKDFVALEDVVALLPRIAAGGRRRLYNVASGHDVTNRELADALARACGCEATAAEAPTVRFPPISIDLVREEFGFRPRRLADDLPALVDRYRKESNA